MTSHIRPELRAPPEASFPFMRTDSEGSKELVQEGSELLKRVGHESYREGLSHPLVRMCKNLPAAWPRWSSRHASTAAESMSHMAAKTSHALLMGLGAALSSSPLCDLLGLSPSCLSVARCHRGYFALSSSHQTGTQPRMLPERLREAAMLLPREMIVDKQTLGRWSEPERGDDKVLP